MKHIRTWVQALRDELSGNAFPGEGFLGRKPDTQRFTAPLRLAFPLFINSETMLSYHDRADWQYVDPKIAYFAAKFIETMRRQGVPFWVFAAFRTRDQQQHFFEKGTSKAEWPRAPHCQGKAVDLVHGKFLWDLTPHEWAFVGKVGKDLAKRLGIEIEWGGDWSFYDPAHWQLKDWDQSIEKHNPSHPIRRTPSAILRDYKGLL